MRKIQNDENDEITRSTDEVSSLDETEYLLRSPANARRLLEAVERDQAGAPGRPLEDLETVLGCR